MAGYPMALKTWIQDRIDKFRHAKPAAHPEPTELIGLRRELDHNEAKVEDAHNELINVLQGRIVSPEIEQENDRRRFMADEFTEETATKVLLHRIGSRTPGKLQLADGMDVEQSLIDSGAYKLGTGPHHVTQANRQVTEAVLVKIQNVRDYYMAHWRDHQWDEIRSFNCVKLPFPKIMFSYDHEFKHPTTGAIRVRHMNVGLATCSTESFLAKALEDKVNLGESIHELHILNPDSCIEARIAIDGISMPGQWYVFIDKMGQVLTNEETHLGWIWTRNPEDTARVEEKRQWAEEFEAQTARHGSIALAAVQFMNCRNVEILDNPPTRQQRRAAEREGRKPDVTYKTLVIHPMGQKRRVVRQADGTAALGVSLHIVRGHFKNYTGGSGLGRAHVHGVYWWSPQVRGSSDAGRVEKDYEVQP